MLSFMDLFFSLSSGLSLFRLFVLLAFRLTPFFVSSYARRADGQTDCECVIMAQSDIDV